MAKQTFTTGSVLTATQMNNLQANDYNWDLNSQTASYVLVAADAGKRVQMNSGSATTVTVNTGLFAAGDTLIIQNIGTGVCTVTAGTATVNKASAASLALSQYQAGILYFVSASSAIFYPYDIGSATGGTGYTLLTSAALTGATTITANFTAAKNLLVYVGAGSSANASATFTMRFNSDSGANYSWAGNFSRGGSTYVSTNFRGQESQYSSGTSITLGVADTGTSCQITGALRLDYGDQTGWKAFTWTGGVDPSGGTGQELYNVQGFYEASAAITSVSIISSTGNFDNGTLYVLGAN